ERERPEERAEVALTPERAGGERSVRGREAEERQPEEVDPAGAPLDERRERREREAERDEAADDGDEAERLVAPAEELVGVAGEAGERGTDDRLHLPELRERPREERQRSLLRLRLDRRLPRVPPRDHRSPGQDGDARRAVPWVPVRVEEPVEPRLEGQGVAEREPEVDEGGELEARL